MVLPSKFMFTYPTMVAPMLPRVINLIPQAGRQWEFLSSSADIVIYGGAAGGGKTYGLLLDPVLSLTVPGFTAVVLRRTSPEITMTRVLVVALIWCRICNRATPHTADGKCLECEKRVGKHVNPNVS